jgi:hypothetical protein
MNILLFLKFDSDQNMMKTNLSRVIGFFSSLVVSHKFAYTRHGLMVARERKIPRPTLISSLKTITTTICLPLAMIAQINIVLPQILQIFQVSTGWSFKL